MAEGQKKKKLNCYFYLFFFRPLFPLSHTMVIIRYSRGKSLHLFILLFAHTVLSQVSQAGRYRDFLHGYSLLSQPTLYNIPAPDLSHVHNDTLKPFRFAKSVPVSIPFDTSSSSVATINSKGDWSWRIKINSDGATSLSLIFDEWWLPEHTEVYVFNDQVIIQSFFPHYFFLSVLRTILEYYRKF